MQLAWKIYAFIFALLALASLSTPETFTPLGLLDGALSIVITVALFLYAFRKRTGQQLLWKLGVLAFIPVDLYFNLYYVPNRNGEGFPTETLIFMIIFVAPAVFAAASYAFGRLAPQRKVPSASALPYTGAVSTPSTTPKAPVRERDDFPKQLTKLAAAIFVGWNALMLAIWWPLLLLLALVLPFAVGNTSTPVDDSGLESVYGNGSQELLSMRISGPIAGDRGSDSPFDALSSTYGYDIKQKLVEAAGNDAVKGVVLEINSPGGTIYGAHAIADGVEYYRDHTHRPVYAYIQGLGASGAYWAAVSTDKIIADYGSDTGSIGVIMGPFKYYDKVLSESGGLFDSGVITQNGIQNVMITAGKSKDIGSPYRKLTTDELAQLQSQVNNDYDLFVKYVSERRHIPDATIRNQIGAMAYDNKTAEQYKLIDQTGSREEAYDALAKAAHIEDDYRVMREQTKSGFLYTLLGALTGKPAAQVSSPGHCYSAQAHLAYDGDVTSLCSK